MAELTFRFYAELNDFLPAERRGVSFTYPYPGRAAIKDVIQAVGVPHTEIDLILVNGVSVDFAYGVQPGDQISVYPVFESLDITPLNRLRPEPLRESRFVLDIHLGRLASHLRLLGFDTLYRNDYEDEELARVSSSERRILLTRDIGLLKRSLVTHGYFVRATNPQEQTAEVVRRFDLFGQVNPFHRCLRCNGLLRPVEKGSIADRLPAEASEQYHEFRLCQSCQRIYWKGSHYSRLEAFIASIREQDNAHG
jgi:uncharacterized protein with PIN domain